MEMLERVGRGEVLPLVAPAPGGATHLPGGRIPSALGAVVGQAMAFEPARRYQSVAELQADVEAFQGGFPTSAERVRPWKRAVLFLWRHRGVSVPAALAILLVAAFGMQVLHAGRRARLAIASLRDTAPSFRELADSEAGLGRLEEALRPLLVAEKLEPGSTATWERRAFVLAGLARMDAAAAELRKVLATDPKHVVAGRALPVFTNLARAASGQWAQADRLALFEILIAQKMSGELAALSGLLQLTPAQREAVVRLRVGLWLGQDRKGFNVVVGSNGSGRVRLQVWAPAVTRIDALRGLPIDELSLDGTAVSDLSPLRGMGLKFLRMNRLPVSDLSPLVGMPLETLEIVGTEVEDIGPLRGMNLKVLSAGSCRIARMSVLAGMPLERLRIGSNSGQFDLRWVSSASLQELSLEHMGVRDITVLRGKPLERLELFGNSIADLSPLAGAPISYLSINRVSFTKGLSTLGELPLRELAIDRNAAVRLASILGECPTLETVWVDQEPLTLEEFRRQFPIKNANEKKR